jgi:outer membrane protein
MKKLIFAFFATLLVSGAIAQSKLGHVNYQTLLDTMPSTRIAMEKLKVFQENGYKELSEMQTDLQAAYAKYEKDRPNMTPMLIKIEEEKIMRKEQGLQERQQSLSQEIEAYSLELNDPIVSMIKKAIKIVADRKKLNYVIQESNLLYTDGGTDITNEVVVELLKIDTAQNK